MPSKQEIFYKYFQNNCDYRTEKDHHLHLEREEIKPEGYEPIILEEEHHVLPDDDFCLLVQDWCSHVNCPFDVVENDRERLLEIVGGNNGA